MDWLALLMPTELEHLTQSVRAHWPTPIGAKAKPYLNQFLQPTRTTTKIKAKVEGNHGTYTVSINIANQKIDAGCSCYLGGGCHHCEALAATFLLNPEAFQLKPSQKRQKVKTLAELTAYLQEVTLDDLMKELSSAGITQKAFAEIINMNPRHLTAIKSAEKDNRSFHELGATKLACLWVIKNHKNSK